MRPITNTSLWNYFGITLIAAIIIVTLNSCAHKPDHQQSPYSKWRVMAEENVGKSPINKQRVVEIERKKIESFGDIEKKSLEAKPLPGRNITLKMHLAEVPVLLRALARSVNLNIMINENVSGKISINVQNAHWDEVFLGILKSQGLDYEWEGEILRIVTIEDRERNLKSLEAEEKILSKQRELRDKAPMVTKIIPIDFANAEKLKENVEKVLELEKEGVKVGTVLVDTHTNSLIVQATPTDITRILPMILELDRPTRQILIEAFIVETTSSLARELGVQWTGLYNANTTFFTSPNTADGTSGNAGGTNVNFPADTSAGGVLFGLLTQGADGLLGVQLSALEEDGELNILSNPSITTLDNAKAIIESGDRIPIPVVSSTSTDVKYEEALLSLEVTPHVIQDDALKLEILTTKNEVDFSRTVLSYPTIISKKAETNVILFDGQTTVIGGLKKNSNSESTAGVPWLSKIPGLGHLFKWQNKDNEMQDLLIFITPRILKSTPESQISMPETAP